MEEKNLRELNMNELEKVSGGVSDFETLHTILDKAGVLPEILALPRKQAILAIKEYCEKNNLMEYYRYAQAVYDCC